MRFKWRGDAPLGLGGSWGANGGWDFDVENIPWCAGGGARPMLEFIAKEVQTDKLGGGHGGGGLGDIEKLEPPPFLTLGT